MCSKNRRDVDELAPYIQEGLTFFFVDHYREVYKFVFVQRCKIDLGNLPKNVLHTVKGTAKNAPLQQGDDEEEAEKGAKKNAKNAESTAKTQAVEQKAEDSSDQKTSHEET